LPDFIDDALSRLPAKHRFALQWFADHVDEVRPWPPPIRYDQEEILLASKAKGIYKPQWSEHALSIRQSLGGRYPDRDPVQREDGSWIYAYFQENPEATARDDEYTNVGLMACWRDQVPVGVMRQTAPKPRSRYRVLGLAFVTGWDGGYFFLEGTTANGSVPTPGPAAEVVWLTATQEELSRLQGSFDPTGVIDARERAMASIVSRRGQPEFRNGLMDAYQGRCAICQCDVPEALEAAHITPFLGPATNRIDNGILLRADIHTLFDLGLISIDPETHSVLISNGLLNSSYADFAGREILLPREPSQRPSTAALRKHREWSGL
jgi:putative restriction endonuclease